MKRIVLTILAALVLTAPGGIAAAADDAPVDITSSAVVEVVVVNAKGEKEIQRQPAAKVLPGDEVIFVNTYTNRGKVPAEAIVINNPVPEHMTFIGGSAVGEGTTVTYSVDGGKTFGSLSELTITTPDGNKRAAAAVDVTNIRWQCTRPLPPNATAEVEFRARLK